MTFERIPADLAYGATIRTKGSKWPNRASGKIEPICLPEISPQFSISEGSSVFTIGSCFARNIERALLGYGLKVPALEFSVPIEEIYTGTGMIAGILNKYTPFSMLNEIKFVMSDTDGSEFLIEDAEGKYWDGQLHTNVAVSFERAIERRQEIRKLYREAIAGSEAIVITLGLIEAWWDEVNKLYLNDTAPRPLVDLHKGRFFFEMLSIEKTIGAVDELITLLKTLNPRHKVLLTVSPVPFARSFSGQDAIVANSYSKSALRVAAEVVTSRYEWVDYYPSFESIYNSDRATTWEDDLVHVTDTIVRANVNRMVKSYVSQPEAEVAQKAEG